MQEISISSNSFVIYKNTIWFVSLEVPYLVCIDLTTRKEIKRIHIPCSYGASVCAYEKIILMDDCIIGISYWANEYFKYNINSGSLKLIDTPKHLQESVGVGLYVTAQYQKKLYSFTRYFKVSEQNTSTILCFDNDKESFMERRVNAQKLCRGALYNEVFRKSFVQLDENIYLISATSNQILKYNVKNDYVVSIPILEVETRISCIALLDEEKHIFIMLDNKNRVIMWNENTNEVSTVKEISNEYTPHIIDDIGRQIMDYSYIVCRSNYVYFIPNIANAILRYDLITGDIKSVYDCLLYGYDMKQYIELNSKFELGQFSEPFIWEDRLYMCNIWTNEMIIIDLNTEKAIKKKMTFEIDHFEEREIIDQIMKNEGYLREEHYPYLKLASYIDYIQN